MPNLAPEQKARVIDLEQTALSLIAAVVNKDDVGFALLADQIEARGDERAVMFHVAYIAGRSRTIRP